MESELRILGEVKLQIEKALTNFKKSPKDRIDEFYVTARLESLEKLFDSFSTRYEAMVGDYGSEEISSHFQEDVMEVASDVYLNYKVALKKALSTFKTSKVESCISCVSDTSPDRAKGNSLVKLPRIRIPVFSGQYAEWSSFRDLFTSLVHNNSTLDNVQRLHYLKTQLSGEAEQLIKHVSITQGNYKKCWDLLESRYNNKKFMSSCILKRLFSQRNILAESANALKGLLDVTSDCLHELSNLGIDISSWDVIVIYVISLKLDAESRKQWELQVGKSSEDLPTFKQFAEFLETRFRALEFVEPTGKPRVSYSNTQSHPKVLHSITMGSCPYCSDNHKLFHCKKFAKENSDQRRDIAQSLGVCFNCLGINHTSKVCRVLNKCRICNRNHHTLLHGGNQRVTSPVLCSTEPTKGETPQSDSPQPEIIANIAIHPSKENVKKQVLLATALVRAKSKDGYFQVMRSLLDQGSQASFITESAAQMLRLDRVATKTTIAGIGGQSGIISKNLVNIKMKSIYDPSYTIEVSAYVLKSLTSVMPVTKFEIQDWAKIRNIKLADPNYNLPHKIDILLGAETYCHILKDGLIKSPNSYQIAQDTHLGWIVSGQVIENNSLHNHNFITSMHAQIGENERFKRLWKLDAETSRTKRYLTPAEKACEDNFAVTTQRDDSGRYVVRLTFRHKGPPCKYGHSKAITIKRLPSLERKQARDVEIRKQYSQVIDEYLLLDHLDQVVIKSEKGVKIKKEVKEKSDSENTDKISNGKHDDDDENESNIEINYDVDLSDSNVINYDNEKKCKTKATTNDTDLGMADLKWFNSIGVSEKREMNYLSLAVNPHDLSGPIMCKVCKKDLKNKRSFIMHAKTHYKSGKRFISANYLRYHQKRKHGRKKRLACELCHFRAVDQLTMRNHVIAVHTGERPYICDVCELAFHMRANVTQDMRTHFGMRNMQCEPCSALFRYGSELGDHKNKVRFLIYTYYCYLCTGAFKNICLARKHIAKVHGIPTNQQLQTKCIKTRMSCEQSGRNKSKF